MRKNWVANVVEWNGNDINDIRSFGIIGDFFYNSLDEAWQACLNDMNETRRSYSTGKTYIDDKLHIIRFYDEDNDVRFFWNIQSIVSYNEANEIEKDCEELDNH